MQINGQAEFAAVPAQTNRTLTLRMCIQGTPFSLSATSGMHIQHRASSSDSWVDAGLIRGWAYLGLRNVGSTWNDYGGTTLTCVADGGWVDFTISIPNTATQVRLNPEYGSAAVNNDIALRQFSWAGSDGGAAPATPTGLSVDSKTSNSITVSWNCNTHSYLVYGPVGRHRNCWHHRNVSHVHQPGTLHHLPDSSISGQRQRDQCVHSQPACHH